MPRPFQIFSQSDYLIQIVAINLHTWWQTVQIQISWLLQKPTDLDLHCLQNRVYPGSAGQGLRFLHETLYWYKAWSENVQRKRTARDPTFGSDVIMPLYLFHIVKLCPLHICFTDWRIFIRLCKDGSYHVLTLSVRLPVRPSVCPLTFLNIYSIST